jgi:hypothetical protein
MKEALAREGRSIILIAKSFVRFVPFGLAGTPLHFERRKAVESSFRGFPPPVKLVTNSVRTFGNCYNLEDARTTPWTDVAAPAKAGVQKVLKRLDSGLHRNDGAIAP